MLYSVNILSIRDGKFGVVWFLGSNTNAKTLKRKKIDQVVVRQTCSDIIDLLPVSKHHASLVMASTLMLGAIKCHLLQVQFLLKDIHWSKQQRQKKCLGNVIDLGAPFISPKELNKVIQAVEAQTESETEAAGDAEQLLPVVHYRQITMVDPDQNLFHQPDLDEQGFGCLNSYESGNLEAFLDEGGLFPADNQTIRIREMADDQVPGAPLRNNVPVDPKSSQNITQMETVDEPLLQPVPCARSPRFSDSLFASPGAIEMPLHAAIDLPADQSISPQQVNLDPFNGMDQDLLDLQKSDLEIRVDQEIARPDQAQVQEQFQAEQEPMDVVGTEFQGDIQPQPDQEITGPELVPAELLEQVPDQPAPATPEARGDENSLILGPVLPDFDISSPRRGRKRKLPVVGVPPAARPPAMEGPTTISVEDMRQNFKMYDQLMSSSKIHKKAEDPFAKTMRSFRGTTLNPNLLNIAASLRYIDEDLHPEIQDVDDQVQEQPQQAEPDVREEDVAAEGSYQERSSIREEHLPGSGLQESRHKSSLIGEINVNNETLNAAGAPQDTSQANGAALFDLQNSPEFPDETQQAVFEQTQMQIPDDLEAHTPPQSHSTMRQDEDIYFSGNIGQEKEKLLSALLDSSSRQIFFESFLSLDDGDHTTVTRRHAAVAFSGLLVLEAERKVCSTQDDFWGEISVQMM